jgi:hypothetical protein
MKAVAPGEFTSLNQCRDETLKSADLTEWTIMGVGAKRTVPRREPQMRWWKGLSASLTVEGSLCYQPLVSASRRSHP